VCEGHGQPHLQKGRRRQGQQVRLACLPAWGGGAEVKSLEMSGVRDQVEMGGVRGRQGQGSGWVESAGKSLRLGQGSRYRG